MLYIEIVLHDHSKLESELLYRTVEPVEICLFVKRTRTRTQMLCPILGASALKVHIENMVNPQQAVSVRQEQVQRTVLQLHTEMGPSDMIEVERFGYYIKVKQEVSCEIASLTLFLIVLYLCQRSGDSLKLLFGSVYVHRRCPMI